MRRKDFEATGSVAGTVFKAVISTDSVDRDGEVMVPQGMNSRDYERNPVLLWNHDPSQPIGRAVTLKRGEKAIEAEFEFAARPDDLEGEWLPDYIRGLVQADAVRGVSIGFQAMEGGIRMATKADVERYGTGVKRVFSHWKLMEVSVVSVPANQDALITAIQKGYVTQAAARKWCGTYAEPKRYTIPVTVPQLGTRDIARIAAEEMAKARGRLVL